MNPEDIDEADKLILERTLEAWLSGDDKALPDPMMNLHLADEMARQVVRRCFGWIHHCNVLRTELNRSTSALPKK